MIDVFEINLGFSFVRELHILLISVSWSLVWQMVRRSTNGFVELKFGFATYENNTLYAFVIFALYTFTPEFVLPT